MSNEAFALSPISARAASPTDADFEAIREAFLETARGRWFLDEYTKRNRNADTAMVLEAVARIENSLAAQKEEQQRQAATEQALHQAVPGELPVGELPSNELPEAMAAVRAIVAAARESAAQALARPTFDEALAPARKCARVIREIAWGLRESGADGRICFLLETQVDAINAACDHAAAAGVRDNVLRAFDQAASEIEGLSPSATEAQADADPVVMIEATGLSPAPADVSGELQLNSPDVELFIAPASAEALQPAAAIETNLPEDGQSAEMAAIAIDPCEAPEPDVAQLDAVREITPEPVIERVSAISETMAIDTAAPASLGASLIASGIVARPASARSDLLAPIRRMSQAEKVAFFS